MESVPEYLPTLLRRNPYHAYQRHRYRDMEFRVNHFLSNYVWDALVADLIRAAANPAILHSRLAEALGGANIMPMVCRPDCEAIHMAALLKQPRCGARETKTWH